MVWLLWSWNKFLDDDPILEGVFSSEEKARAFWEATNTDAARRTNAEEVELDPTERRA